MSRTKDIRLEIKARNNLILSKMEGMGIETVSELCRLMGYEGQQARVGLIINMKLSARLGEKQGGAWRKVALDLAEFFACTPEDLFSDTQQYQSLKKNIVRAEIAFEDIRRLSAEAHPETPDALFDQRDLHQMVSRVLQTLSPRQERVLRLRFGIGSDHDHTYEEIGQMMNVARERVRQIEATAIRNLKHPARSKKLRAYIDS